MLTRILTAAQVTALLPMRECIELEAAALRTLAEGGAVLPLRTILRLPEGRGVLGLMPAWLAPPGALGLKAIAVFPRNEGTEYDTHQGLVLLFDPERGVPLAVMEASSVTAIRTAAVSGVATRVLARPDAGDLAILGTGVQARTHLEAMACVRTLRRVRAWSPKPASLEGFIRWARTRLAVEVQGADGPRAAVTGADLICTVSSARTPIVEGAWLAEGAHLNAVGSSVPTTRELDTAAVARARLYVDRRESALAEAGDFLMPRAEGAITDAHIVGELGEVLAGRIGGRRDAREITLFKSLGLGVEDVAAAHHVLRQAEAGGVGTVLDLGGRREPGG